MRKKSIKVFICVYAALCISYCVVSSGMVPDNDDIVAEYSSIQTASKETSSKNSNSEKSAVSSGSDMSVSDKEASIESSTELSEPFEKKETTESIEPSEDIIKEYDDGQQYEEQTEEESEDETVEDKPSLEEFLRGLRCSGCRHNCTLFSPRCMNGARKASQAESQYYQMYQS